MHWGKMMRVFCLMFCTVLVDSASQVVYDVTCTEKTMKVTLTVSHNQSVVFVDKLRGFPGCEERRVGSKRVIELPIDNFHECGTTRMINKPTGHTIYYNRIIIDQPDKPREVLLVKCALPGDRSKIAPWHRRSKRDVLPEGFFEYEDLNITNVVAYAPTPYLNLAVRQNGRILDTTYDVQPGTPLEMIIYLDQKSSPIYGLLASYLKVTDGTSDHEEIIVMNGCSIDPYIFANFETPDEGKSLYSQFRAFKFPDSNYVLFVGTVNVCLKECKGVPCGNGQLGYGRKKREIPAEMPLDTNKLYEVEMTTAIRVEFATDHFKPKKAKIEGKFEGVRENEFSSFPRRERIITENKVVTEDRPKIIQVRTRNHSPYSPAISLVLIVVSLLSAAMVFRH